MKCIRIATELTNLSRHPIPSETKKASLLREASVDSTKCDLFFSQLAGQRSVVRSGQTLINFRLHFVQYRLRGLIRFPNQRFLIQI